MEGGAAVEVNAVDVDAFVEQVLHSLNVPSACHEEQLHGGVEVLRHGELGLVLCGAPPDRVERRLPPEAEPEVVPPRIQRRLPRELPAQALPQRPRRELPRYAALQLRGNVFHGFLDYLDGLSKPTQILLPNQFLREGALYMLVLEQHGYCTCYLLLFRGKKINKNKKNKIILSFYFPE